MKNYLSIPRTTFARAATPSERARTNNIGASIEMAPSQAIESADLPGPLPPGTRLYITDIGTDNTSTLVRAARRVTDLGYTAVPHIACRRLTTSTALEERLKAFADAGVRDVLAIGGDIKPQVGAFSSSMEVIETGLLDKYGITQIGIAGHPEGSRDFSEQVAIEALRTKQAWGERTGATVRIVTQFGFDADTFVGWAQGLRAHGIDSPVHLGVAGPAKITTLLKYAKVCGVGNSINFLKKRATSIATLAVGYAPDDFVQAVEVHLRQYPESPIEQLHVFPFGGMKTTAKWLKHRGSWR